MNKVSNLFRPHQSSDLQGLANQVEIDYGTEILEELTGQSLTRRGQHVRLFDQTANSAEAYYPADEKGKPYVMNFQEGRRLYPISAWMQVYDVTWKTAVRDLAKRYLGDSSPSARQGSRLRSRPSIVTPPKPATSYHNPALLTATLNHYERNNLALYLRRLLGIPVANELLGRFQVGTCLEGIAPEWARSTVFWQIDEEGRIRAGKIVYYNPATGRRMKAKDSDFSRVFWWHEVKAMRDFNLEQCFFGLHQLHDLHDTKPIAIVESEKTAIICTAFEPGFIWLACGGLGQLNAQKCKPLSGRQIVLFPDLGGFQLWSQKAEELGRAGYSVSVSNILEGRSTGIERYEGLDIADFLTRHRCPNTGRVLNEIDGYPALWDCEPMNDKPTIKEIFLTDYLSQTEPNYQ